MFNSVRNCSGANFELISIKIEARKKEVDSVVICAQPKQSKSYFFAYFLLLKMVLTGSAPETDSLEIAQVAQTIKTIDLAEDDAEDVDFVVPDEDLEVKRAS